MSPSVDHQFPILDRKEHFDEASKGYAIRKLFMGVQEPIRKRLWTPRRDPLDQGREGRCVVFGWGGELACTPHRYSVNNAWCNQTWPLVVAEDRKMGNNWSDGASVLAGAKAMKNLGKIKYYAWAFSTDDILQTLSRKGPVVLGINWYESMYYPDKDGLIRVEGKLAGGHCILASGIWPNHPKFGDVVILPNSWGPTWGINGIGYLPVPELDKLFHQNGECCIPTDIPVKA